MMTTLEDTKNQIVVGLTGQSGAGKTLACNYFNQCGFGIINCDSIARDVLTDGSDCLHELTLAFTSIILNEDGTLNRKLLSGIVFNSKDKLKQLNNIIFPYIIYKINNEIKYMKDNSFDVIIIDAPTLFESGVNRLCDIIISVIAQRDLRIKRIINRDGLTTSEVASRINSQYDEKFFIDNSNFIIQNNSSNEDLLKRLRQAEIFIKERVNGN